MTMSRRNLIKLGLTLPLAPAMGATLWGCQGAVRAQAEPNLPHLKPAAGLDLAATKILHYAALAPSSHNSQPWLVTVEDERTLILSLDPTRRLAVVDPSHREGLLSLGAFLENLILAAGALGLAAESEVAGESADDSELVRIELRPGSKTGYPLSRIVNRRTVRSDFLDKPLADGDFNKLAQECGGRLFYFPARDEHGQCIAQGTLAAFREQTADDRAQAELARWIRFSNAEARQKMDGLTPATMGLTGLIGWFVCTFYDQADVLKPSFRDKGVEKAAEQIGQGAGWLILTSRSDSVADIIDAGRRFERLALTAREMNLAVHPMTQILEEESGRAAIAANHDRTMIPQFILRVGYLDSYPEPVSLRRPVERFIRAG